MRLSAKTNVEDVIGKLDGFLGDVADVALPRALNKLADQAQTAGLREISRIYGIGPRTMEKYVTVRRASRGILETTLTAKGNGFPLTLFQPRQTKQGVTVKIKGRRVLIPHAFIATMASGHVGVFARGSYGGRGLQVTKGTFGRFVFGRSRRITRPRSKRTELAINEIFTLSPPDALSNPDVTQAMEDRVVAQQEKVIAQEIRFAARG